MATITGGHHIAFTVTDVARSCAWYSDVLGLEQVMGGDDDDVSYRVLAHPASGWLLGLRQYHEAPKDGFDELRTGLDHFAFGVSSRAELDAWVPELERRGIEFTPPVETPIGTVIVLRDPDRIQLELWLPMGSD